MEIAIALLILSGVGVLYLDRYQRSQQYAPYQTSDVQALRALYQIYLLEDTYPEFSPRLERVQRRIWQEEQEKFAKENCINVDSYRFRRDEYPGLLPDLSGKF